MLLKCLLLMDETNPMQLHRATRYVLERILSKIRRNYEKCNILVLEYSEKARNYVPVSNKVYPYLLFNLKIVNTGLKYHRVII